MKMLKRLLRRLADRVISDNAHPRWTGGSPALKAAQLTLLMQYRQMIAQEIAPKPVDTGMRVFSGTDDDGVLLFIFAALGFRSRKFVDIGAGDGINCNCANLALNFGFHGLLVDGDPGNVARGRAFYARHLDTQNYPPTFRQAFVTAENINALIAEADISGEIDLLSIDIDGNDFWVWKAITQVRPRVVIIETHIEFGKRNVVVPYDAKYCYPGKHPQYHGASPGAMLELGRKLGYRLVATNGYGFNFIFVRNEEPDTVLPAISLDEALVHPRNGERLALVKEIEGWEYTSA